MTQDEFDNAWEDLNSDYDIMTLCRDWHSGQFSAFYAFQCTGRLTDPSGMESEARHCLKSIESSHEDFDALTTMLALLDQYPTSDED